MDNGIYGVPLYGVWTVDDSVFGVLCVVCLLWMIVNVVSMCVCVFAVDNDG